MVQTDEISTLLNLFPEPAFSVMDGIIECVNRTAQSYLIEPGQSVASLLSAGVNEYTEFTGGTLYLTLTTPKVTCGVSVTRMGPRDFFVFESEEGHAELRAYALAAQQLRLSLSNCMLMTDRLFPKLELNDAQQDQVSRMNRSLYQMLRTVSNMSDASRCCTDTPKMETVELCAFLQELFDQARDLGEAAGISVRYAGPSEPVYMLADSEMLERAVLNLLSNAIKFTPKNGGPVQASLTRRGDLMYLTVADSGSGIPDSIRGSIFTRYRRTPSIEDSVHGLGLGMVFVRAAASAHSGAVLVEQPEAGGTRVTMTLKIRKNPTSAMRSPIFRVDYTGERSHGLVELSDTLPASLYDKDSIN